MIVKAFLLVLCTWGAGVVGKLIFEENFDGNSLNTNDWTVEVWPQAYNNELEYYTDRTDNVKVENGALIITPLKESYGGKQYTSGRLKSKFAWKYGRVEVRAKLPKGDGLWPAIWMLPRDNVDGGWPNSGEIDICEARGNYPYQFQTTIHYGTDYHRSETDGMLNADCTVDEYHVYQLDWTPTALVYSFDGQPYFTQNLDRYIPSYGTKGEPFNEYFYLILNVAVGGDFLDDPTASTKWSYPDAEMHVDYVRVYDLDSIATYECAPTADSDYTQVCDGVEWACGSDNVYADVSRECTRELTNCCNTKNCQLLHVKELATDVFSSYDNQLNSDTSCDFGGAAERQYILNDMDYAALNGQCLIKSSASNEDICGSLEWACSGANYYADVSSQCNDVGDVLSCCYSNPYSCNRDRLVAGADEVFQAYYDKIPSSTSCDFGGVCYLDNGVTIPLPCDTNYHST